MTDEKKPKEETHPADHLLAEYVGGLRLNREERRWFKKRGRKSGQLEYLKEVATSKKALSFEFTDARGNLTNRGDQCTHVTVGFHGGDQVRVTFDEFCTLGDFKFTLMEGDFEQ